MRSLIQTPRLEIRSLSSQDEEALSGLLVNEHIKKTYLLPDFADAEALHTLACRFIHLSHDPNRFVRGIYLHSRLIGFVNDVEIENDCIELGYVIHPDFQRQGYATEMLAAVLKHLLNSHFSQVKTGAFSENTPSIRVMEKCGMKKIPQTDILPYRGIDHVCVYYELRRDRL